MRAAQILLLLNFLIMPSVVIAGTSIICASTTSTQNSGLYEYLLPIFQQETGIKVNVVALGTGAALEAGKRGDADVLFVHSKADELSLVSEGYFINRRDIMYNDFIIIGPVGDPAGIAVSKSAADAFAKIAKQGEVFITRGDNSGTYKKEMSIWKGVGIMPASSWYKDVGQGMAKTIRVANEMQAYTLADRGTWLSMRDKPDLVVLFEGDPALLNQYGAMAVNPALHKHAKYNSALRFIDWLASPEGQRLIGEFSVGGQVLFKPNASPIK